MARFDFNSSGSSRSTGSRYKKASSSTSLDYEALAREIGIDPEKEKQKNSFLETIFDWLGKPQQAAFNYVNYRMQQPKQWADAMKGQKPRDIGYDSGLDAIWKGLSGEKKVTGEDLLANMGVQEGSKLFTLPVLNKDVSARDAAGFGLDIVADPLNAVGVGVASKAVKGIKVGNEAVALSKAGNKALQTEKAAAKALGLSGKELDDVARKTIGDKIFADPKLYRKYVDKGGLKIAGKSVLPQKTINKAVDVADKIPVVNIPVKAGKGAKSVADSVADLFKQGYKAKQAGGEAAVDALGVHKAAITNAGDVSAEIGKTFLKNVHKAKPKGIDDEEALQMVRRYVERPDPSMPDWIKPHVKEFQKTTDELRKAEQDLFKAAGRDEAFIEDYYPRLFRNNQDEVDTVVKELQTEKLRDPLNIRAGFTKERQLPDLTIDEIVEKGAELGFDLKPVNAAEALAARTRSSIVARTKLETATKLKGLGVPGKTAAKESVEGDLRATESAILGERDAARTAQNAQEAKQQVKIVGSEIGKVDDAIEDALASGNREVLPALREQRKALAQDYAQLQSMVKRGVESTKNVVEDDLFGQSSLFKGPQVKTQEEFLAKAAAEGVEGAEEGRTALQKIAEQTNAQGKGYVAVPGVPELEGFRFPPEVAKYIQKELTTKSMPKGAIMKALDSFAAIWKGSVTTFPTSAVAFNARNKLGNMFNMYLAGVDNPSAMKDVVKTSTSVARQLATPGKGVKKVTDKFGEDYTFDTLKQLGIMGGQVEREVGKVAQGLGGKTAKAASEITDKIFAPGQKVGQFVESPDRVALFIHARNQGKSVDESVAYVNKYLFDYANPTKTVKAIGRVIPFFTWTANNIPLQVERLVKTPGKYSHLRAMYQTGMSDEDRQNLPEYVREGLTLSGGQEEDEEGNIVQRVITNMGIPAEDLQRLNRGSLARTVERELLGAPLPILREPLEEAVGRDFFRGKDLDELATTYGFQSRNYPQFIKDAIGYKETEYTDKNGNKKISYSVDPVKYKRLDTLPIGRILNTLAGSETDKGDDLTKKALIALEKGTNPVSVKDYNLTEGEKKSQDAAIERLRDRLIKAGKLKQFTKDYIPKEDEEEDSRGSLLAAYSRYKKR